MELVLFLSTKKINENHFKNDPTHVQDRRETNNPSSQKFATNFLLEQIQPV